MQRFIQEAVQVEHVRAAAGEQRPDDVDRGEATRDLAPLEVDKDRRPLRRVLRLFRQLGDEPGDAIANTHLSRWYRLRDIKCSLGFVTCPGRPDEAENDMRAPFAVCAVAMAAVGLGGQAPGDRPASNPRATRSVVLARNGVIATSQPLASAAGLAVLQQGGNAIDAAVTAAAVLSVVEPTMNGIGGDLFALVYDPKTKRVRALNASGRAPASATLEEFSRRGLSSVPYRGELSVSVPGVVDGWSELLAKHGTITLAKALEPAVRYAREGYAVSEIIATQWKDQAATLEKDPAAAATYLVGGQPPRPGEIFRNPKLAASLEQIAKGGRDAFYRGAIAKAIAEDMRGRKGLLTDADLAAHTSDWTEALSTHYRGFDVLEFPPNTQGVVALEMLNILEGFDLKSLGHNSGRVPAPPGRSQEDRVRGSRCLARGFRGDSSRCSPQDAVEGVRRRPPQGDRSRTCRARLQTADDRRRLVAWRRAAAGPR